MIHIRSVEKTASHSLLVEPSDAGVVKITLNRPRVANAIDSGVATALRDTWRDLASAPLKRAPRCVHLCSAGDGAFCGGADLKERAAMASAALHEQRTVFLELLHAMAACPIPIVVAVQGAAFGGGFELALLSDLIVASEGASFALPETARGLIPGLGGTVLLARHCGLARANAVVLAGRELSAHEAENWGIVHSVCATDELDPLSGHLARRIAARAPLAQRAAKACLRQSLGGSLREALAIEDRHYRPLLGTQDLREGLDAFRQKREPRFCGS